MSKKIVKLGILITLTVFLSCKKPESLLVDEKIPTSGASTKVETNSSASPSASVSISATPEVQDTPTPTKTLSPLIPPAATPTPSIVTGTPTPSSSTSGTALVTSSATPVPTATPTATTTTTASSALKDVAMEVVDSIGVGTTLYALDARTSSIKVIDTTKDIITASIPVNGSPIEMDILGNNLYVATSAKATIQKIDISSSSYPIAEIIVDSIPSGIAVSNDKIVVSFYSSEFNPELLDLSGNKLGTINIRGDINNILGVPSHNPSRKTDSIDFSNDGKYVYLASSDSHLMAFDVSSTNSTITSFSNPIEILATTIDFMVNPMDNGIYLTSYWEKDIRIFSVGTPPPQKAITDNLLLKGLIKTHPDSFILTDSIRFILNNTGSLAFSLQRTNTTQSGYNIQVFDTAGRALRHTIDINNTSLTPKYLAVSGDNTRLYCSFKNNSSGYTFLLPVLKIEGNNFTNL